MREVESGARKKRRKRNLQRAVLLAVGTAGLVTVMAAAPNALQLLETTGINARLRYRTKNALGRLKQKGEIEFVEHEGKKYARLTEQGEKTLAFMKEKTSLATKQRKKWDQRFRLVMFDVPERRKRTRDRLRREMQEAGFLRLQDSAWVYPYDCEEFVALLKADLHIGRDVLYAVIEEIDNDISIRKHFGLPNKHN